MTQDLWQSVAQTDPCRDGVDQMPEALLAMGFLAGVLATHAIGEAIEADRRARELRLIEKRIGQVSGSGHHSPAHDRPAVQDWPLAVEQDEIRTRPITGLRFPPGWAPLVDGREQTWEPSDTSTAPQAAPLPQPANSQG